jgi:hypothetical protein
MAPIDDTALYVRDTGGRGRPAIYLNGAYADPSLAATLRRLTNAGRLWLRLCRA